MSGHHDRELKRFERQVFRLRKRIVVLSSPLEVLLKRRGFQIFSREPVEDLLIPSRRSIDGYYAMMGKYSFRLFLRDVIKHQDFFTGKMVARYATADVTRKYIGYLRSLRLVSVRDTGYAVAGKRLRSFGETLEWYVAEILRREFAAETIRGIKFKGRKTGGDYDILAKMDGEICYIEVKSSPPKQIYESEIAAFLDRIDDLSPEVSIFLMDTELRMKDKIVPMFEAMLAVRRKEGMPVVRIEKELFHIGRRIYIINAKDSIAGNIRNVLGRYFRDHDDG